MVRSEKISFYGRVKGIYKVLVLVYFDLNFDVNFLRLFISLFLFVLDVFDYVSGKCVGIGFLFW